MKRHEREDSDEDLGGNTRALKLPRQDNAQIGFSLLPFEMQGYIFSFLSLPTLLHTIAPLNRHFYRTICEDSTLWIRSYNQPFARPVHVAETVLPSSDSHARKTYGDLFHFWDDYDHVHNSTQGTANVVDKQIVLCKYNHVEKMKRVLSLSQHKLQRWASCWQNSAQVVPPQSEAQIEAQIETQAETQAEIQAETQIARIARYLFISRYMLSRYWNKKFKTFTTRDSENNFDDDVNAVDKLQEWIENSKIQNEGLQPQQMFVLDLSAKWFWQNRDTWKPYTDDECKQIEESFIKNEQMCTTALSNHNINFTRMKQVAKLDHTKTRNVKREGKDISTLRGDYRKHLWNIHAQFVPANQVEQLIIGRWGESDEPCDEVVRFLFVINNECGLLIISR